MGGAKEHELIPVEDYLAGEGASSIKHEYLGGIVYAMAGTSNQHTLIASNTLIALGARLRGKPCRASSSDAKVRLRFPTHVRFYYPDAMVVCQPNPAADQFQDLPVVLFEVISPGTRRTDESEKKDAYLTLPSLVLYALAEQSSPTIVAYRRTDQGFVREIHEGLHAGISLDAIGVSLPLAEIYDRVEFLQDPDED